MPGKVTLTVINGPKPKQGDDPFVVDRHDTLLFGRGEDCQASFDGDMQVSRHHFMMEVNPPDVCIRDLGSKHGTYINGTKYGGRAKDEGPEEGAKYQHPTVNLRDGDEVKIGKTLLRVGVEIGQAGSEPVSCQRCGKNVTAEVGPARKGAYICDSCRQKEADPGDLLLAILERVQAKKEQVEIEIPDYEIEKLLGKGGMGAVYMVRHKQNGSRAAMKVMLAKVAVNSTDRARFLREINVTHALQHKNVVRLITQGDVGSIFYFVLEYCNGGSVDKLMEKRGGYLSVPEAAPIMLQTLEGLAYVHKQGVVHRDLKPQNILLSGTEHKWTAKVADMGLAKSFDQAGFSGMTVTGQVIGTFAFMPREQVTDFKHYEPISDVWAIGATFYNMLTGSVPRDRKPNQDPLEWVLKNPVTPIRRRNATIPAAVAEVIDRSLETNVNERYQSVQEMYSALTRALAKVK